MAPAPTLRRLRVLCSAAGLAYVLAPGCAEAQDLKAARACTRLSDDVARLSCYDAALGAPRPAGAGMSTGSGTPTVAAEVAAAQPASVGALRSTSTAADFGDNGRLHPKSQADLPKNITAQVKQATTLAYGLYLLTLDNGEVWRTTQADSALVFKPNDKVVLSRRVLGGYEISLAGRNASVNATRMQ